MAIIDKKGKRWQLLIKKGRDGNYWYKEEEMAIIDKKGKRWQLLIKKGKRWQLLWQLLIK